MNIANVAVKVAVGIPGPGGSKIRTLGLGLKLAEKRKPVDLKNLHMMERMRLNG